jgi:hypothetical protein
MGFFEIEMVSEIPDLNIHTQFVAGLILGPADGRSDVHVPRPIESQHRVTPLAVRGACRKSNGVATALMKHSPSGSVLPAYLSPPEGAKLGRRTNVGDW